MMGRFSAKSTLRIGRKHLALVSYLKHL